MSHVRQWDGRPKRPRFLDHSNVDKRRISNEILSDKIFDTSLVRYTHVVEYVVARS